MRYYRDAQTFLRIENGAKYPVADYGYILLIFRSNQQKICILLRDVAHVPDLSYQLYSLRIAAYERLQ